MKMYLIPKQILTKTGSYHKSYIMPQIILLNLKAKATIPFLPKATILFLPLPHILNPTKTPKPK
jgi:hypothetical protein